MTHDTNPPVSIGMPVWNGARYLREAIDSLIGQTYGNIELIISDNFSDDGTAEICKEYAAKDKRVRYARQEKFISAIENFNFVLRESRGDYFMWAAHDDVRDKSFVEKAVERFKEEPGLALVFCGFERFDEKGEKNVPKKYIFFQQNLFLPTDKDLYARLKKYILLYWVDGKANPVYGLWNRREIGVDGFTAYKNLVLDTRFIFRMLARGGADILDEVLFWKRADFSRPFRGSFLKRILNTAEYRRKRLVEHLIASGTASYIWSIENLTVWQKLKLTLWHLWVALRLFLRRKS